MRKISEEQLDNLLDDYSNAVDILIAAEDPDDALLLERYQNTYAALAELLVWRETHPTEQLSLKVITEYGEQGLQ